MRPLIALAGALGMALAPAARAQDTFAYDVVIYGGTAGGVMAGVQAARMGKSVALLEPGVHLGGMTTGGLSYTDTGNAAAIQGIAREFYLRCGQAYGSASPEWHFEPKVAESVLEAMIAEAGVAVYRGERLDLAGGVAKTGSRIDAIRTESGHTFQASMFIDAGYEGDLMARAGVSYTVGREANATYGETYNGIQKARSTNHQFGVAVDPYRVPGSPASGLLPYVSAAPPGTDGEADARVQAYNFRLIVTQDPANKRAWTAPAGYDPANYELLRRTIQAAGITAVKGKLLKIDGIRGSKFDVNNQGAFSTDFIGMNYAFPDGDYAARDALIQAHRDYQQGLLYFLATDPGLPQSIRDEMNSYGLTLDEFAANDGWSTQLYIREARRMLGRYVMTDLECRGLADAPQPVALGSYTMDSHNTQRYVTDAGAARNEGNVQVSLPEPYGIAYGSLTPQEAEASNLLVTSAVSASHIAYGSIRMEPVFMELGQAAGTAAALAIDSGTTVQGLDYAALRDRLIADGALIGWPTNPGPPWTGLVAADLNDFAAFPTNLKDQGGGTNLAGLWFDTGTLEVVAGDLATARGGYAVVQTGPGQPGKAHGVYNAARQIRRELAGNLEGTIWFSFLLENPDATAVVGLTFNPTTNADPAKGAIRNFIQLLGDALAVNLAGTTDSGLATLAVGETHLLLGCMVIGPDADTFDLWADPADIAHLGPPTYSATGRDFIDALSSIAILSYNPAGPAWTAQGGYLDALRISNDPAGALMDVTGVPEPATLGLVVLGGLALAVRHAPRSRKVVTEPRA